MALRTRTWAWAGSNGRAQTAPDVGTVLATLPGARDNLPNVVIAPAAGTSQPSSLVTVTLFWQAPNETTRHQYIVVAQIGG